MSLAGSKIAGGNPARGRVKDDFYATPPSSTRKLLELYKFKGKKFLEPCCGAGHLAKVVQEFYPDIEITAFDLVDRGYGEGGVDFLTYETDERFDFIITNPPYKYAQEFIERSLTLVRPKGTVAMFLKLQFLEGVGRASFFEKYPPKYIYVFSARQSPWMNGNPVNEHGKKWATTICFAWYIWEQGFMGEPVVRWL